MVCPAVFVLEVLATMSGDHWGCCVEGRGIQSTSRRSQPKLDKHPPQLKATMMVVRWGEPGVSCQSQSPFSSFQTLNTNLSDGFAAVSSLITPHHRGTQTIGRQHSKSQIVWWVRKSMRNSRKHSLVSMASFLAVASLL